MAGNIVEVKLDGADAILRAFRKMPKDASDELRVSALALSEMLASRITAAGLGAGGQAATLARTVKPKRDRIPSVSIGGTRRVFRGKKDRSQREAFRPMAGSEWGGMGHGFKPPTAQGYWIRPTVIANRDAIGTEWKGAAERIIKKFENSVPPVSPTGAR